jgi:hypothetical protein
VNLKEKLRIRKRLIADLSLSPIRAPFRYLKESLKGKKMSMGGMLFQKYNINFIFAGLIEAILTE